MMQLYARDKYDLQNCDRFEALIEDYPELRFSQPSPDAAPWHVQCVIETNEDEPIILNFWPHKAKGQRQPMRAVEGFRAIRQIIDDAIQDAAEPRFDVIETDAG